MIVELWHGTHNLVGLKNAIAQGELCGENYRRRDAGDFGLGFYCTDDFIRARAYGQVVAVTLDIHKFALVKNPYFIEGLAPKKPRTNAERLLHDAIFFNDKMLTVDGPHEQRERAARRARDVFLAHGYEGIVTHYHGDVVCFSPAAIKCVRFDWSPPSPLVEAT